ncbi:anti-sigma-I factor RsgI family protein [Clostridium oryzae]|uniref:Putative RNA polymerase sigma factor SigI n=1 Tax=Clostridium oryzae TaxID=1450648 RepID=A0A1V4ID57_9CLOT|nr:hypothetical protein [Clostridium oryzae]OPJ57876.1 putative RNA polymerase sigma factor SigI [Clostridium oryzae]
MDIRYMMLKDRYYFLHTNMVLINDSRKLDAFKREVSLFIKELSIFDISLIKLSCTIPSISVQNELLNIAVICSESTTFSDYIRFNSELPIKKLASFTKKNHSFFNKWQNYIILYYLLLSNDNYSNLLSFLNIHKKQDSLTKMTQKGHHKEEAADIPESTEENFGLVLSCSKKKCFVLTPFGYIKIVNNVDHISPGEICMSKPETNKKGFKFPFKMLILYLIIFTVAVTYIYTFPEKKIVIKSNFIFQISVNKWNKVISVKPLNGYADKIKYNCNVFNKNYDEATVIILKTAEYLKYIDKKSSVNIYVKGKRNSDINFRYTINYFKSNKLNCVINNNGSLLFER